MTENTKTNTQMTGITEIMTKQSRILNILTEITENPEIITKELK